MKNMPIVIFFGLLGLLGLFPTSVAASEDLPNCVYDAARKYGAPEKVFKALVIAERVSPNIKTANHHGSMNLHELIIPFVSDQTGIPEIAIKADECLGYYAAAWLLMDASKKNEVKDIWDAIYLYYYGNSERFKSNPVKVLQVRKLFEKL
ncbi:hypothetical protein GOP96_06285 [Vibrio cholerae]|nr:hypothetical protein [Vibrio cholerae]MEB5526644.1 hypothetical protein [Vibrio cholerae]